MSHLQSEHIDKLFPALHEVQKHLTGVQVDAENDHFKAKYPTLEAVMRTIRPVLTENDLFLSQLPNGESLVTLLCHTSGQWIGCETALINKKGDAQGMGSAITYARRYAAMAILGLSPEDDDGNEASRPAPKSENEIARENIAEALRSKCKCAFAKEADAIVQLVTAGEHGTFKSATETLEESKVLFNLLTTAAREHGWENLKTLAMEGADAVVS